MQHKFSNKKNRYKKLQRRERNRLSKMRKAQRRYDRNNKDVIADLQATYSHLAENGMIEDVNGIMPIDISFEIALHEEEEELIRLEKEARMKLKKENSE